MHKEILSQEQIELLEIVKLFNRKYILVGGTAIALHIGHRYSLDFDLFTHTPLNKKQIKKYLDQYSKYKRTLIWENQEQVHFSINGIKFTFFQFPYKIDAANIFEKKIKLPSLLDLAAMKAFALGGRAKWKDYVDLYFILKKDFSFNQIALRANELFGPGNFNAKLFKEQLSYFKDINYEEEVFYLDGFETSEEEIKSFLIDVAVQPF